MKIKFNSIAEDNTQQIFSGNILFATIFHDFNTIVFENEIKALNIDKLFKITNEIETQDRKND